MTDEHGWPIPPEESGEVRTLRGFLDFQRATLAWKCRGLSDAQLRVALPPTSMTLGGMLKHMSYVEEHWFTGVISGEPAPESWAAAITKADSDWDWTSAVADSGDELRALREGRVQRSDAIVSAQLARGEAWALRAAHRDPAGGDSGRTSLRWVLVHMIEEYARHNGHADLIRESIDGQTGE
jgi:uncharacterized damage-inducible protein DinB